MERRQRSEEEDDGEDTSSSSQESEDVGLREEKALSDSEIRVYLIFLFKNMINNTVIKHTFTFFPVTILDCLLC